MLERVALRLSCGSSTSASRPVVRGDRPGINTCLDTARFDRQVPQALDDLDGRQPALATYSTAMSTAPRGGDDRPRWAPRKGLAPPGRTRLRTPLVRRSLLSVRSETR